MASPLPSASMSEIGETIVDNNFDAPTKEPTISHIKRFRVGSGNIIGKGAIQDFLLVPVLYPLWVVLSFIELVVLQTLLPCL